MSKSKKSLEDRYWEIRAEEACRIRDKFVKAWASVDHPPELKIRKGPNKTRSSFNHAQRNKIVSKLVPIDCAAADINFLPIGTPALYDIQPVLAVKNILEYIVIKREGRRECLLARGFTKCCAPGAACERKRCAKCWALEQKQIKGVEYVVREVISGLAPKIVDPYGVHPKGKRSSGKDLDFATRARFKLTSSQAHYKAGNSEWNEQKGNL